jgi:rubrerythrin
MTSTLPAPHGSPWDEALLEHLDHHVDSEQEILDSYAELAATGPEYVQYLVGLIVDEEERHHRMLREMANRVQGDIEYRDVGPSVPHLRFGAADRDRLVEDTQRFLQLEREDLQSLKGLGRVLRQQRLGGLFPLMVSLMELDTKKHIAILEFIAKTARRPY